MILAIDPGLCTGWAEVAHNGKLFACGATHDLFVDRGAAATPDYVVIERPQVYRAAASKGDPNDLITLAIQVGEYKQFFERRGARVVFYRPSEWKGQLPKKVHHRRVWDVLDDVERSIVGVAGDRVPAGDRHNLMDAVALGKWYWNLWVSAYRD